MSQIDDLDPPYTRFINAYATGFDTWQPVQQNPNLARILGELSTTLLSGKQDWTLDGLFALPPKRLQYYKKLYSRLLKTTSPGRSDHRLLVGANETLDKLIATCEERRSKLIGDPSDHDISSEGPAVQQPSLSYPPRNASLEPAPAVQLPVDPIQKPVVATNFQLPPLAIHADSELTTRTFSEDAPTSFSETATIVGPKDHSDGVPPSRVQSPEISISNAFRKPVDGERVSSSTMGSRIDSSGLSMSR